MTKGSIVSDNTLAVRDEPPVRGIIRAGTLMMLADQRKLLGEYIASQMKPGVDYGEIPGTKNRALLKPGAEKLTDLYRCTPQFEIVGQTENWETGFFHYTFRCRLFQRDAAVVLSEGFGSCSSYESKYRWRNASQVCPACRGAFIIKGREEFGGGWLCFKKKGGCGAKYSDGDPAIMSQKVGRVQNEDLADVVNTVLKMAKKRSHVDAAIALAGCSDLFTQDIEDEGGHLAADDVSPRPPPGETREVVDEKTGEVVDVPVEASGGLPAEEDVDLADHSKRIHDAKDRADALRLMNAAPAHVKARLGPVFNAQWGGKR
jgi:hypothetical protein